MARPSDALFSDGNPVPVAEVKAMVDDATTATRIDGPQPRSSGWQKARDRKIKGQRFRPSHLQWMKCVACFKPLWDLALQLEAIIEATAHGRAGRRREYKVIDALLFEIMAWNFDTYLQVSDNFADEDYWRIFTQAVAVAYPDEPKMRLSDKAISRDQHYRFRKRYLSDHLIGVMHNMIDQASIEAALSMGMLNPHLGSLTNPDPSSFITGDGCWVPALTSLTRHDAVDPVTGEILGRFDRHALPYRTSDNEKATSPGYLLVMLLARNPYKKERVVLSNRLKSAYNPEVNRNDATIAVDMILDLLEKCPGLRAGLVGMVYDMALSTADFDRLLDAGLIPVSKVPRTKTRKPKKGKIAAKNLGKYAFKAKDGTAQDLIITAVNGTPCITCPDGDGVDCYVPLKLRQVRKTGRRGRPLINTLWVVADKTLVPARLQGAVARIRHNPTKHERDSGKSHSRALRILPESDERFDDIFGRREDSESANSDLKNRLWNSRCRTMSHNSVEFNNISYQIHTLITALVAYHNRTGADMSRWFGQHKLPRKEPLLALAA